ncbi:MAG TPA: hypothetical protein VNA21_03880 [Steroidobacteraceae bacterium]|jgi:hypothetical protein|nr:hypothetical protein [Steroidobacteraceae bacterium]
MDEYTFLIAAALKADRLKLEREQPETTQSEQRPTNPPEAERPRGTQTFIPLFSWR